MDMPGIAAALNECFQLISAIKQTLEFCFLTNPSLSDYREFSLSRSVNPYVELAF